MNFYIDTEFLEGTQQKTILGLIPNKHTQPTIDLISIGVVDECGNEYYDICKEFNVKGAWNRYDIKGEEKVYWLRENVLKPVWKELEYMEDLDLKQRHDMMNVIEEDQIYFNEVHLKESNFNFKRFKKLLKKHGSSKDSIAENLKEFIYTNAGHVKYMVDGKITYGRSQEKINFYGYYADYDWVAFCWLFGKMINLPKYFPMYCKDLKQIADNIWENTGKSTKFKAPKGEHNALEDAKWNKKFHDFLNNIK